MTERADDLLAMLTVAVLLGSLVGVFSPRAGHGFIVIALIWTFFKLGPIQ